MLVLWHRGGPAPCNGPALGTITAPPSLYEIPAEIVRKIDGSVPAHGEPMLCGTCGRGVHPQWLGAD